MANAILISFLSAAVIFNSNNNQIASSTHKLINPAEADSRINSTTASSFYKRK